MKRGNVEFRLTDNFMKKYKRKKVDFGPLGYFVHKRTYARDLPNGKTEEWWQTIQRVVEGCFLIQKRHCADWKLPWSERRAQASAQTMYDLIFTMKFLPPGRGLWSMGTDFVFDRGSACLQNCGFTSTGDIDQDFAGPFVWLMDMSLVGVGVGFDTDGAGKQVHLKEPRRDKSSDHMVEDSREGWVKAFKRVLDAFSGQDTLPMAFNYSQIRPAGAPILGAGGIAPGPGPLEKLIQRTIDRCWHYQQADLPVDSTFIVDIMNFAGAAVVAGGIRRTAEIAFGSPDDEEFLNLKEGKAAENDDLARWASNNSVIAEKGMDYSEIAARAVVNGEPGLFWLDNARAFGRMKDGKNGHDHRAMGCNPCGEQTLEDRELCNLVETFPSRHSSKTDYLTTLKYAYMYAKTVTLLSTHDPRTNAVLFRNRRIGLSQSGIIEQINKVGFREHLQWCEDGYQALKHWDEVYSDWFCIPKSRKMTSVKPSGTVSLLPGVPPGIHYPHSEYYIRRVQVSTNSPLIKIMKTAGYKLEDCVYADDTFVIDFPVHENFFSRSKDEVSMWEQFELAAAMQRKWADNQVSITITIRPEEERDLAHALSMYENRLKAVSFLPIRGDAVYKQAPYEKITEAQYKKMAANLKPVKYDIIDAEDRVVTQGCDGDTCELVYPEES